MAVTSGSYTFQSTNSDNIICEAYERIIGPCDVVTGLQLKAAKRAINFILTEWSNRGFNLWTLSQEVLGLTENQNSYLLPIQTNKLITVSVRNSVRQLGGVAQSSSGVAQNAFDNNPLTACIQNAPNGYIEYFYGLNSLVTINMVGIQSNINANYTIVCEYSYDNLVWNLTSISPRQFYPVGEIIWIVMKVPTPAVAFRIRETGGATLNIQELYFNNTLQDILLSPLSNVEYASLQQKNQIGYPGTNGGKPNSYWFDRQIQPIIYLWPVPSAIYNCLYYTRTNMLQDVGDLTNIVEIPARFYSALVTQLAFILSLKIPDFPKEKRDDLEKYANISFELASRSDTEDVPLRISGNSSGYGSI